MRESRAKRPRLRETKRADKCEWSRNEGDGLQDEGLMVYRMKV